MALSLEHWEARIGRRLRLRDLHVLLTVVQCGSMAKAARQLSVSQPAISKAITDLEHTLGVRLMDRGPQGIEPTLYGNALVRRGLAATGVMGRCLHCGNCVVTSWRAKDASMFAAIATIPWELIRRPPEVE